MHRASNDRLATFLNSITSHLADRPSSYDHQVFKHVAKVASRIQAQMKPPMADHLDSFCIIAFLDSFKRTCDNNRIHGGATL